MVRTVKKGVFKRAWAVLQTPVRPTPKFFRIVAFAPWLLGPLIVATLAFVLYGASFKVSNVLRIK